MQEELYSINPDTYEAISNCYESISSENYTDTVEDTSDTYCEDEY